MRTLVWMSLLVALVPLAAATSSTIAPSVEQAAVCSGAADFLCTHSHPNITVTCQIYTDGPDVPDGNHFIHNCLHK